jgi:hypothetical protein
MTTFKLPDVASHLKFGADMFQKLQYEQKSTLADVKFKQLASQQKEADKTPSPAEGTKASKVAFIAPSIDYHFKSVNLSCSYTFSSALST